MTSHPHDRPSTEQRQRDIDTAYSEALQERRRIAFHQTVPDDWKDAQNPVGMALSGGGLRSALFNVGLLQACAHRGLLRYIDYLSSVSGGGYASGWLMSMHAAAEKQAEKAGHTPPSFHDRPAACLGVDPHSEQVGADYHLGNSGSYLNKPLHFLWQYVALTVPLLALFLGILFSISTVLALIWRSLDQEANRTVLADLGLMGIADEFFVAILPALLMTLTWGVSLISLQFPDQPTRVPTSAPPTPSAEPPSTKLTPRQRWVSVLQDWRMWWLPVLAVLLLGYEVQFSIFAFRAVKPLADFSGWLLPLQVLMTIAPAFLLPWAVWCWHRRTTLDPAITPPRELWRHPAVYCVLYLLLLIREPITTFLTQHIAQASPLDVALWPVVSVVPGMWRSHVAGGLIALGLMVYSLKQQTMARRTACCRTLFFAALVCWAVSFAVFLGNGESRVLPSQQVFQLNQFATVLAVLATVLQLLPAFFSRQLLNSDREDSSPLQRGTYVFLTWVAPVFVFFAVAHVMSRENISGYATFRDSDLLRTDVLNWSAWDKLRPVLAVNGTALGEDAVKVSDQEKILQGGPSDWEIHDQQPLFSVAGCSRVFWQWINPYASRLDNHLVDHWKLRVCQREALADSHQWLEDPNLSGLLVVRLLKELEDTTRFSTPATGRSTTGSKAPYFGEAMTELPSRKSDALEKWIASRRALMETDWTSSADKKFRQQLTRALRPTYTVLDHSPPLTGPPLQNELSARVSAVVSGWSRNEISDWNRLLLEVLEPRTIRPREMVTTGMMAAFDQRTRCGRLLFFSLLCGLAIWRVDFNRCGAFYRFYRSQLSLEFLSSGAADDQASTQRLSTLSPQNSGLAIPLFCAARLTFPMLLKGYHNPPRSVVFSPLSVGWQTDTPLKDTSPPQELDDDQILRELEQSIGRNENWWLSEKMSYYADRAGLTLADAVTVSGSAVTPLAVPNWPLAMILTMLNLRLGRWLPGPFLRSAHGPNPDRKVPETGPPAPASEVLRTTLFRPLNGLLRPGVSSPNYQRDELGPYFVADGGFDDFLGAMELLRRRCRLIIISDAGSNSGKDEFGSLSHLIRSARQELGVRFYDLDSDTPLVLDRYRRSAQDASRVPQQFFCCRAVYPVADDGSKPSEEALVLYLQMSLTGREEIDLQQFRLRFPNFPDEPIQNQVYTPQQVEAYRQLGYHIGRLICSELPPWLDSARWTNLTGSLKERPISHPARRAALSFLELKQRLQLAFFWECHRERMFEQSEASAGRMFTNLDSGTAGSSSQVKRATEIWSDLFGHPQHLEADQLAQALLDSYENDSDFRQAIRSEIFQASCASKHPDGVLTLLNNLTRNLADPKISASSILLSTIAMAVNDLLVYDESRNWIQPTLDEGVWERTALDLKSDSNENKPLPLRNPFKIGGRELLMAQQPVSRPANGKSTTSSLVSERDASQLYRVAYDIFREHGPATALLTVRCLQMLLADPHTNSPAHWTPNIPAARKALHRRDCNAFASAIMTLSSGHCDVVPEDAVKPQNSIVPAVSLSS